MKKLFNWFLAEGFVVNDDFSREIRASRSVVAIRINKLYNGYLVTINQVWLDGIGKRSEFIAKTADEVMSELVKHCVIYQS